MFVVATVMFPGNYHNVRGGYRDVPRNYQSGNSRFCSCQRRKKKRKTIALTRENKNKNTKKHKNTPIKHQKNTNFFRFRADARKKPLASKKTYFPSHPKWNETKKNPALETTIMFVVATGMFRENYHNVRGGCRNVPGKLP